MVSKNIKLVRGVLDSLVEDSHGLVVMDLGSRGLTAYHPDNLPKDLAVDILLLGNMKGIETGLHLVNARKLLTDEGIVFMWDFSVQRLPKGKSQETVVMSVVSKEG